MLHSELARDLSQAERKGHLRRTKSLDVQYKAWQDQESEGNFLRAECEAVRANDQMDAVFQIGEVGYSNLRKLDVSVHEWGLKQKRFMYLAPAVQFQASILEITKAVTEEASTASDERTRSDGRNGGL